MGPGRSVASLVISVRSGKAPFLLETAVPREGGVRQARGWGVEAVRGQVSWLGWQGAFREGCTAWGSSRDPGREALPSPQLPPAPRSAASPPTARRVLVPSFT